MSPRGYSVNMNLKEVLVSFFISMSELLPKSPEPQPTPSPPSQTIDLESQRVPASSVARQDVEWQKIIMAFCFASALSIALQSLQIQSPLPLSFHLLSMAILLTFSALFVAKFVRSKFPTAARVLEQVAVFVAAGGFFLAIAIPLPLHFQFTTWSICAISLLSIIICGISE